MGLRAFIIALIMFGIAIFGWLVAVILSDARAMDMDGARAKRDPILHEWFDKLASGKGLCCSFADGRTIEDPDIDMNGAHYKVRIDDAWIDVPDDAIVTEPNKFGRPVVWPYFDINSILRIRCFLPGSGA